MWFANEEDNYISIVFGHKLSPDSINFINFFEGTNSDIRMGVHINTYKIDPKIHIVAVIVSGTHESTSFYDLEHFCEMPILNFYQDEVQRCLNFDDTNLNSFFFQVLQ